MPIYDRITINAQKGSPLLQFYAQNTLLDAIKGQASLRGVEVDDTLTVEILKRELVKMEAVLASFENATEDFEKMIEAYKEKVDFIKDLLGGE